MGWFSGLSTFFDWLAAMLGLTWLGSHDPHAPKATGNAPQRGRGKRPK